jgi:uncharacterized protein
LAIHIAEAVLCAAGNIELDGAQGVGARLEANIIDCDPDKLRIGDKVEVVLEKVSDTLAVPKNPADLTSACQRVSRERV